MSVNGFHIDTIGTVESRTTNDEEKRGKIKECERNK